MTAVTLVLLCTCFLGLPLAWKPRARAWEALTSRRGRARLLEVALLSIHHLRKERAGRTAGAVLREVRGVGSAGLPGRDGPAAEP